MKKEILPTVWVPMVHVVLIALVIGVPAASLAKLVYEQYEHNKEYEQTRVRMGVGDIRRAAQKLRTLDVTISDGVTVTDGYINGRDYGNIIICAEGYSLGISKQDSTWNCQPSLMRGPGLTLTK